MTASDVIFFFSILLAAYFIAMIVFGLSRRFLGIRKPGLWTNSSKREMAQLKYKTQQGFVSGFPNSRQRAKRVSLPNSTSELKKPWGW